MLSFFFNIISSVKRSKYSEDSSSHSRILMRVRTVDNNDEYWFYCLGEKRMINTETYNLFNYHKDNGAQWVCVMICCCSMNTKNFYNSIFSYKSKESWIVCDLILIWGLWEMFVTVLWKLHVHKVKFHFHFHFKASKQNQSFKLYDVAKI